MTSKIRQWFYLLSGLVGAFLPILLAAGVINLDTSNAVTNLVGSLASLIAGGAAVTAGVVLKGQRKDGTVDAPEVAPEQIIANTLPIIVDNLNKAQTAKAVATKAITDVLGTAVAFDQAARDVLNSVRLP